MTSLFILVEEPSMAELLRILLPQILPHGWQINKNCFIRIFEGKNDLQANLQKQARVFAREPDTRLLILHDQDSTDCKSLKEKLRQMMPQVPSMHKIRIVCKELESWYFGDIEAIAKAYPKFNVKKVQGKAGYRQPDLIDKPAQHLVRLISTFQKGQGARRIGAQMNVQQNKSNSFQQFVLAIKALTS